MSTWILAPKWWACLPKILKKKGKKDIADPSCIRSPSSYVRGLRMAQILLIPQLVPFGIEAHEPLKRFCSRCKNSLSSKNLPRFQSWPHFLEGQRGWREVTVEMDFLSPFCLKMKTHHILPCESLVQSRNTTPRPSATLKTTQQSHDSILSWTSPDSVSFCNIQSNL